MSLTLERVHLLPLIVALCARQNPQCLAATGNSRNASQHFLTRSFCSVSWPQVEGFLFWTGRLQGDWLCIFGKSRPFLPLILPGNKRQTLQITFVCRAECI